MNGADDPFTLAAVSANVADTPFTDSGSFVAGGNVLTDHADWLGLQQAISETGAERILVTHGYAAPLARWLREQGKDASVLSPDAT